MDIIKGTKRTRTDHIIKGTKGTNDSYISKRNQANQDGLISKVPSEPGRIISKGPSEPGRILSKEPSEPLYYQRNQVNQNIIKGTERTLATNYILAKEPTNKLEN